MPQVGKKKFSYSKTGKAKAKAYAKKTGYRVKRKKQFMKKGFHIGIGVVRRGSE